MIVMAYIKYTPTHCSSLWLPD